MKLKRPDIAALDSGVKSLIATQWSTLVVLTHWWCAAIDRRAAYLQGMGESQPTIILKRTKFRINIDQIPGVGNKGAPGGVPKQVVTRAGDRAMTIRSVIVVLGDDAVLYGNSSVSLIMNASRDRIIGILIVRIVADRGIIDIYCAAKIIDSTASTPG